MVKRWLIGVLWVALLLAGCRSGNQPAATPASAETSTSAPATLAPVTLAPATQASSAQAATSVPAGCTVISPRPTPGPTQDSLFPPVSDADWTVGPQTAAVTFIEYSDFQ